MKKWGSVVLALVLLAVTPFVKAEQDSRHQTTVSEASCCCCPPAKAHIASAACQCDSCAQKKSQNCGRVQTAPALSALPVESSFSFTLSLSGWITVSDTLYVGRTDSPLLRPPIFS
ncbi:MAG: hypothetical protein WCG03_03545 [Kiritimatiellales bacterium]